MRTGISFALGAAAGPANTRLESRERADKIATPASSSMSAAQTQAHHAANKMKGVAHAVTPHRHEEMDDQTLADRVRSEIFRAPDAPKGSVSVDVQAGEAYLRGEVADPHWVDRLGRAARQGGGSTRGQNLLPGPGAA